MGSPYKVDKLMLFKNWIEKPLSDCKFSQNDSRLCEQCHV